jgi:leucyl/phenylalanyl-tRNA--protein transferase
VADGRKALRGIVNSAGVVDPDPTLPVDMPVDPAIEEWIAAHPFPDPTRADRHGLLAYGGDLSPERLIAAYAQGVFPWYEEDPILWFSPDPRMVLLPADLIVNRTLDKNLRRGRYEVRIDTAFRAVIESCARVPRKGQPGTWITQDMIEAYSRLHDLGFAHSAEAWLEGELVGGVYGVSLGAAFFAESMFAERSDASKVALVHLVWRLEQLGAHFLDCQCHTDHTERLGATEWPRERYLQALATALKEPTWRGSWGDRGDT